MPSVSSEQSDLWVPFDSPHTSGVHGYVPDDWVMDDGSGEDIGIIAGLVDYVAFSWPPGEGTRFGNGLVVVRLDETWDEGRSDLDTPGAEAIVLDAGYSGYWLPQEESQVVGSDGLLIGIFINVDGSLTYIEAFCWNSQASPGFEDDVRRFVSLLTFTDPQPWAP